MPMNREYHKWYSSRLQRDMELLVFGHGGRAVLFFPTRRARFYDYENWGIVNALSEQLNNGELTLFCVDSIDNESFYNQTASPADRITRHVQYEQYIIHEVIPMMQLKNGSQYLEVAGCSMGAYHAANLAFKYPKFFKKAVCMSGRYDLTQSIEYFDDLFSGYHNNDIYFNMPGQYLANMPDSDILNAIRQLNFIIVIGETDPFITDNQYFTSLLQAKNIPHQLYIWNGYAHRPRYWRQMVKLYL